MKKWKAVIVHPAVTGAAGAVLGAGAICLALFLAVIQPLQKQKTEYQLQSDRLTAACAAFRESWIRRKRIWTNRIKACSRQPGSWMPPKRM